MNVGDQSADHTVRQGKRGRIVLEGIFCMSPSVKSICLVQGRYLRESANTGRLPVR